MSKDQLTIVMAAKKADGIPVGSFKAVLDNLIGILRDVEPINALNRKETVDWRITDASFNSPFKFSVGPAQRNSIASVAAVATLITGMRLLESGTQLIPPQFKFGTLERAKTVVQVLDKDISTLQLLPYSEDPFRISQRVAAHVDLLLPGEHWEIGSIEGRMETLSIHSGMEFVIWDRITGSRVECFLKEDMLPRAAKAFGKRVLVSGRIRYTANCNPERITVHEFLEFPEQADLPQFSDLRGILV